VELAHALVVKFLVASREACVLLAGQTRSSLTRTRYRRFQHAGGGGGGDLTPLFGQTMTLAGRPFFRKAPYPP